MHPLPRILLLFALLAALAACSQKTTGVSLPPDEDLSSTASLPPPQSGPWFFHASSSGAFANSCTQNHQKCIQVACRSRQEGLTLAYRELGVPPSGSPLGDLYIQKDSSIQLIELDWSLERSARISRAPMSKLLLNLLEEGDRGLNRDAVYRLPFSLDNAGSAIAQVAQACR